MQAASASPQPSVDSGPPSGPPSLRRVRPDGLTQSLSGWPLHDTRASRALESTASQHLPAHELMRRAGLATARLSLALAPHAQRVVVLCGPGNNGGDGLEAAAVLRQWGRPVEVVMCADATKLPPDAQASWQRAARAQVPISTWTPWHSSTATALQLSPRDLVVDALLGLGQSRAPAGLLLDALRWANTASARGTPCLAVDLPTGLNAETGCAFEATACINARWTLSLLGLKPGLFTAEGRDVAGDVWWDDLGLNLLTCRSPSAQLTTATQAEALLPSRRHAQHKGSFGDLWVVGGAPSMSGALLLAARAAAAVGAGRVYACPLDPAAKLLDSLHPEIMFRPGSSLLDMGVEQLLGLWRSGTIVAGCGGGSAIAPWLPILLERAPRLVLDADALNALARDPRAQERLRARSDRSQMTVLTPHPLEAARLLDAPNPQPHRVQADRLGAARELAQRYACSIVLKGSGSVIASPDQTLAINSTGNASLATGGTGDVLAGMIGGLMAQGLGAHAAALLATFEHGAAADRWRQTSRAPLLANHLVDALSRSPRWPLLG